jgi:CubicO group peptidase (beta-lactamase class C family)
MRIDSRRLIHAQAILDDVVASGGQACALAAVANRDGVVWSHAVPGAERVSADSIFLLASITKPMLATGVMRLVEQGRLLLEKPVRAYLPEFGGGAKDGVSAWNLLTHTSGLDESEWMSVRMAGPDDGRTCFEFACRAPVSFEPGSRCSYCTLSFAVLAELIARLSGRPYWEFLRDEVFGPLAMPDTAFEPIDPARAAPVRDMGPPGTIERFTARKVAGGGMWSTLGDLARFGRAFLRGGELDGARVLSPATVSWMTRNHTLDLTQIVEERPAPFDYGLGWGKMTRERCAPFSPSAFAHGGATGTLLHVDPEYDLVFVYLTNRWGAEQETPRRLLHAVYGAMGA